LILGIMNASATAGAILTPVIVPMMALALGWRAVFVITGGLGLVWVLVWFALVSRPYFRDPPAQEVSASPEKVSWLAVLADRRTWAIAGAKALSDQVWWFLLFWMPDLFTRAFHLDMHSFGVPLGAIYTCGAIGSLIAGYIPGRMLAAGASIDRARKSAMLVSALLVLPTAPLVLWAGNYWVAVGLLGLVLAAHQGFSVNLFATATDIVPSSRVGSVVSFGAFCGNMAGMLVLQVAGHILSATGSYAPMFWWIAVAYLLALAWLHLLLPRLRPAGEEILSPTTS
jgi:MFS transporter, ACS family, hexuronate transporter